MISSTCTVDPSITSKKSVLFAETLYQHPSLRILTNWASNSTRTGLFNERASRQFSLRIWTSAQITMEGASIFAEIRLDRITASVGQGSRSMEDLTAKRVSVNIFIESRNLPFQLSWEKMALWLFHVTIIQSISNQIKLNFISVEVPSCNSYQYQHRVWNSTS